MIDKELQEIKNIQKETKERIISEEDCKKIEEIVTNEVIGKIEQEIINSIQDCNDNIKKIQRGITAIQEIDSKQCSNIELMNVMGSITAMKIALLAIVGIFE